LLGVIFLKTFLDIVGNKVELSFEEQSFPEEAKHVLVITQNGEDWVLTNHKKRGLEFPGGKMEAGETLEEAARREVYEETGAVLSELLRLGEYRVEDQSGNFVKAVFWGRVNHIDKKTDYHETRGPAIIKGDILMLRFGAEYSFIMKDEVIAECFKKMEQLKKNSGN
jgi:8-oxo-dGTP diphosphatase